MSFYEAVYETAFMQGDANVWFNARGLSADKNYWQTGDNSLISTIRALTAPKYEDGFGFELCGSGGNWSGLLSLTLRPNTLTCFWANSGNPEASWVEGMEGLEEVPQIYDCTNGQARGYSDGESRSLLVINNNMSYETSHKMQVALPYVLPQFFGAKPGEKLTDLDRELLASLLGDDEEAYQIALNNIYKTMEKTFQSEFIVGILTDAAKKYNESKVSGINSRIADIQDDIESYTRSIANLMRQLDEQRDLFMVRTTSFIDPAEVINYVQGNKNLKVVGEASRGFYFTVTQDLVNFDDALAEAILERDNTYLYSRPSGANLTKAQMRKLFKAIFVDREIVIQAVAAYEFNYTDSELVTAMRRYDYSNAYTNYMPNPHLDNYSCLGENHVVLQDYNNNKDWIGLFGQLMGITANVQLTDPSAEAMVRNLYTTTDSYLRLPNGEVVNPIIAVKWLEREDEE